MTFQEAVLAANDSEAKISFDRASRNPYFAYVEDNKEKHTVWFLDAVTAFNQMVIARKYYPAGFALWRLGSEDPSIWSVFGNTKSDASVEDLRRIRYGYDVDLETGRGASGRQPRGGAREIEVDDSSGLVTGQSYITIPSSYVIRRTAYHPGQIALTFDDGPDREWTPRILDLLKQEQVPATFFIIGSNGQANPQLVRRILAEGHDLGNHTFTHPNLGEMPGLITNLALTATQRLIEAVTGRSTKLFRPPYFGDAEPTTPDEVEPVVLAQALGYLTVGLRNDPDDWALPGADEIVKRTIESATNPDPDTRGQVVLLHDGGGDRSQTLAALPRLISDLRQRVVRDHLRARRLEQDQAMPPVARGGGAWDSFLCVPTR
jgi:peptidoglycan/xylan/chitin deacetylase (PgdA/CDA1 family)